MSDDSDSGDNGAWTAVGNSTCLDWHTDPSAIWPYCPSLEASILFTVLFFLATAIHIGQAIAHRKRFSWVIIMAGTWEFAGFVVRTAATRFQQSLALYVPMQLLILLAPLWANAFVYMVFGRLVWYFLPEKKIFGARAEKLTLIFVLLDILSFFIQGTGGGFQSNSDPDTVEVGIRIYMAGMGLQQAFLIIFAALLILFHRRALSIENSRPTEWRWLLYLVYAAVALITVRIIFRLAEFAAGRDGPIAHTESYFYVFDALPMLTAIAMFNVYHPGRALVGPESEFPKKTKAEKKEDRSRRREERIQLKELKSADKANKKGGSGEIYEQAEGGAGKGYAMDTFGSGGWLESNDGHLQPRPGLV